MKILIACIHYPVASGRYMTDAFKRQGHDVRHIGPSTGNNIWGGQVADRWVWESNGDLTASWPDWTPDLVLVMDSAWAYHHPVYADVPHAVYGVDNHVRDYRQPGIVRYFLAHKDVSIMPWTYEHTSDLMNEELDKLMPTMKRDDPLRPSMATTTHAYEDMEWLPCGYDPHWFTPSPIPFNERAYDVALLGVPYPRRVEIVQAMQEAGLKVIAGSGYVYEDYRDIYHNARISLCVSVAGDVAQRIFETAAMGCAVLSDPLPDLEAIVKTTMDDDWRGSSILTFDTVEKAVELAQWAVHEDQAEDWEFTGNINNWMKQGQDWHATPPAWTLTPPPPHSWDARAVRIAEWWQEAYAPKPKGKRKAANDED